MILRKIEGSRFSVVCPLWAAHRVVIFGGGPSLTVEQAELVGHEYFEVVRSIAVNDAYLIAPFADVCYFADSQWWEWHTKGIAKPMLGLSAKQVRDRFSDFRGQKCSIQRSGANIEDEYVHILRNMDFPNHGEGISLDPGALATGRNSAFQAINLAILAGAKTVLLLGIDGKLGDDGRTHFHGDHPKPTPTAVFYEAMRKAFSAAENPIKAAGVRVINCSPGSAIDSFPKMTIEEALA